MMKKKIIKKIKVVSTHFNGVNHFNPMGREHMATCELVFL